MRPRFHAFQTDLLLRRLLPLASGLALLPSCSVAHANDWPQWRGPNRNGISAETGWSTRWSPGGPRRLWTANVGEGFSSVAVKGGKLYTMGHAGGRDMVTCLNAATGKLIWRYPYPCESGDYSGPRATPTVDGNSVYTISRQAQALCLNATTGKLIWRKDLAQIHRPETPQWGFAGSALVYGNSVLFNVGTAGVSLNKQTGNLEWYSGDKQAGYSSPVLHNINGTPGVALFVAWGVVSVNPANGRAQWQMRWDTSYGVNAADPIISGNTVFISSNYGHGCALLRVANGKATPVWENRNMKNHFNSCILLNGGYFGNDEGRLRCLDAKTGNERWSARGIGRGGLIAADNKLIILSERGELVVAAADPGRYTEIARAKVLDGTCWTHPVLANGLIYCRSHEGQLVCVDVRGR